MKYRSGLVLILVLAVLTMLALLAVVFARLAIIERSTSRAYTDLTRARMHAQSGIFMALAKMRTLLSKKGFSNDFFYYGEDLNGDGQLNGTIEDQNGDGILQTYTCPLHRAVRPSFMKDLNNDGKLDENDLIEIRGKRVGISGLVPGTYKPQGDFYAVRVKDLSGKIYVNMEGNKHLRTILENLAEATGLPRTVGEKIFNNRPYVIIDELESKAGLTKPQFNIMKQFLTVYAWHNKKVVQPVPAKERIGKPELGQYIYAWEEMRPKQIDFPTGSGRAPVNINIATKEVLIALLQDLKGFYLNEGVYLKEMWNRYSIFYEIYSYSGGSGTLGVLEETPEIDQKLAGKIAESIIYNREIAPAEARFDWEGPFTTWQQFNLFCNQVLWQGQGRAPHKGILTAQQADVLKANFNPNSNINDFNPDFHRMFWVDKTDLTYHTTEFIFHSTGYFAIDSIGRVLGKEIIEAGYVTGSKVLAEAEINTVVKVFEVYQETTQQDFLYEYWKEGIAIKDNIIRGNKGFSATTNDLTLQTYPEILEKAYIKDAHYDGHISLATIEPQAPTAGFIARYSRHRLNADKGPNLIKDTNGPYVDRLVASQETTFPPDRRAGYSWKPGKLFPDGVYSEIESVPMYNYRPGDFNVFAVSLWIKPHFFPENAAKTRVYLTYQSYNEIGYVTPLGIYNIANTTEEGSKAGYGYWESWDKASFLAGGCGAIPENSTWEGGVATPCLNHIGQGYDYIERPYPGGDQWGTLFRAGKWLHLAWIHQAEPAKTNSYPGDYYYKQPDYNFDILYVNGIKCTGLFGAGGNDVKSTLADYYQPGNVLRLGEKKTRPRLNSASDSTLDEIIIWDNIAQAETEILNIYKEGRYYKENDLDRCGVFTSRPIDLAEEAGFPTGSQVTLFLATWTQYVPETLPAGATCEVSIVSGAEKQTLNAERQRSPVPNGEPRFLEDPAGSLIKGQDDKPLTITKPIRYQVFFRPKTGNNNTIVDSLIFDDITILYFAGPPRFLSWLPVY